MSRAEYISLSLSLETRIAAAYVDLGNAADADESLAILEGLSALHAEARRLVAVGRESNVAALGGVL